MSPIETQTYLLRITGKSILELTSTEITDALMNYHYEMEMMYDEEYDHSYEYEHIDDHIEWEYEQEIANAYDNIRNFTHWQSHINNNMLFSMTDWPIEDENEAFRMIWRQRIIELV